MGHQFKRLIISLILTTLAGCELDLSGLIISDESVNQRFEQSAKWNDSHPNRELIITSDNYFILSMGDSHVGGTDNLNTFINIAEVTKAAAIVAAGDLTTGNASDYDVFQETMPADQDSLPYFLMVGNHDLWYDGWNQFYSRFGSSTYMFTIITPVAKDLFICLDSGSGTLGKKQLDWLKEILETFRNEYRYCFVFTHTNLFRNRHTFASNPPVAELHVLIDLFTKHDVDMVIAAHDHFRYEEKFGNTIYITMDALEDGLDNSGYFKIKVNGDNLNWEFINF
jgi:hypothetical protein